MKTSRLTAAFVTAFLSGLASLTAFAAQPDPVFDAMRAELKRATTLTLNQLEKPYFVSYGIDEGRTFSATATNGGLISSSATNFRVPEVHIRVGDYKFDNTNYAGGGGGVGADARAHALWPRLARRRCGVAGTVPGGGTGRTGCRAARDGGRLWSMFQGKTAGEAHGETPGLGAEPCS